jgi:hypothetical protein
MPLTKAMGFAALYPSYSLGLTTFTITKAWVMGPPGFRRGDRECFRETYRGVDLFGCRLRSAAG